MLTERQKRLFREIPKAENHIHIEGSIPWDLALQLAERNHVKLPYTTEEEMGKWAAKVNLQMMVKGLCFVTVRFNFCLSS